MSTQTTGPADSTARMSGRRSVATYSTHRQAERAVDHLSDNNFPVERTAIVGRDLQFVEPVTGRMTYGDAAIRGAVVGGIVGLMIGWLFALFNWFDPVVATGWLILDGFWFGLVVGALAGVIAHALLRGRRDFTSIPTVRAEHYDVLVDEEVAEEAKRLLAQLYTARTRATA